jgi:hypothetical protein
MTTITNEWIPMVDQYNGINVERKFCGINCEVDVNNNVIKCDVKIWQRELYPNGTESKCYQKIYTLQDLVDEDCDNDTMTMKALAVLSGYIASVGLPYIINPVRTSIADLVKLPFNFPDGYPINKETREKVVK